jgi:2OG-Fe(II) oxygenase superfamily
MKIAGKFAPHYDYRRLTSLEMQSFMSVNIYLNDVPELHKGATRILQHPHPGHEPIYDTPLTVLGKIQPVQGTASIFRDTLWHDGEELLAGEKYLLRTDVMYEREGDFDFERVCKGLDGSAKANKALEISYALADGGNLPEAEAWRARAFTFHTDAWLLEKYSG